MDVEVLICVGGDGTILRALHEVNVPIFGINIGELGFLTEISPEDTIAGIDRIIKGDYLIDKRIRLKTLLNKKLPRALVNELQTLWWPDSADTPLAGYSDKQLAAIGDKINQWRLKPSATEGYRTAEVTLGGVDTASISSKTMEAKQHPGLFFIGEVLDVTGHLGGFNFQWAWSSGYSAGLFV